MRLVFFWHPYTKMSTSDQSSESRNFPLRKHQDICSGEPEGLLIRLGDWFQRLSGYFKAGNHSLLPHAIRYAHGLLQASKANLERMSEVVPNTLYQNLHHFVSHSPWDDDPIRAASAGLLNQLLGGTPQSGLLIDETAFTKKGKQSVGVTRQWSGQLGKTDSCQVAVFSALCNSEHACLLDAQIYIPLDWSTDPERCQKAGIPAGKEQFKPKTQLALELIQKADAMGVKYAWTGVDAGYGKDPAFLRELDTRNKIFFADVQKTQRIYLSNPVKKRRYQKGKGALRRLSTLPKPMTVEAWVKAQPKRKWKNVFLRQGSHGAQYAKILHGRVWVWDGKEERPHAWHIIVRRRGHDEKKPDDKYTLSNAPGNLSTKKLTWYQSQRYKVEQSFQEAKQELGMDDYQVRGWRAWHHHITLTILTMGFLVDEKIRFGRIQDGVSLRSICELIVALLPKIDFETKLAQVLVRSQRQVRARERGSPG